MQNFAQFCSFSEVVQRDYLKKAEQQQNKHTVWVLVFSLVFGEKNSSGENCKNPDLEKILGENPDLGKNTNK